MDAASFWYKKASDSGSAVAGDRLAAIQLAERDAASQAGAKPEVGICYSPVEVPDMKEATEHVPSVPTLMVAVVH